MTKTKLMKWSRAGRRKAQCPECDLPMGKNNWKRHWKANHRGKMPPFPGDEPLIDDKQAAVTPRANGGDLSVLAVDGTRAKRKYTRRAAKKPLKAAKPATVSLESFGGSHLFCPRCGTLIGNFCPSCGLNAAVLSTTLRVTAKLAAHAQSQA